LIGTADDVMGASKQGGPQRASKPDA